MEKESDVMFTPFSNGTEAMMWVSNNCDRCTKAFIPKNGEYPSDETMKQYISIGKECKLKYHIDYGFITGKIPLIIAKQIGLDEVYGLKESCMFYSDNEDDGFKYPKKPKPDTTPDNQMVMPFELDNILDGHEINRVKQLKPIKD